MSRKKIFKLLEQNKPVLQPLPGIDPAEFTIETDNVSMFLNTLNSIGANVYEVKSNSEAVEFLNKEYPDAKSIISTVEDIKLSTIDLKSITSINELDNLDLAIINGQFGVAENGAVWIPEKEMGLRSVPFIAKHLVIILDKSSIAQNMHEAYLRLQDYDAGYGVFISGPSKTADIEQSLVIGVHGPLSLTLLLF